jgi:acetyl esterase/lipase
MASKDSADPLIHSLTRGIGRRLLPATFDRKDPHVSPLFADLTGFPPVLVQVGSEDATR